MGLVGVVYCNTWIVVVLQPIIKNKTALKKCLKSFAVTTDEEVDNQKMQITH